MSWPRITDLFTDAKDADIALVGAPMDARSVNPADYHRAPGVLRETLKRFSTYDVETGGEIELSIRDHGDVPVQGMSPEDGFAPVRDAVAAATAAHGLTLLVGGHNGVTRPAAHGLGVPIGEVGLITLDAHFDLRGTEEGLMNGNPVRALLEDGLPGANICQIGLAPFANTAEMHRIARDAGIGVWTIAEVKRQGIAPVLDAARARLGHCAALMVDFDIDVIDRAQCPGAPGARPGGMSADMFFEAARLLAADPRVRLVDLTEFDPGRDVGEVTALTAARWACEILAGYTARG
ncbi:MAG: arginase family protein [Allosphingosinicella sp.]|uniref:arginase family protein n=1 Tax=Allosphingosinicella sp. TaxID=2823234 RepID=UPI00392AD7CF